MDRSPAGRWQWPTTTRLSVALAGPRPAEDHGGPWTRTAELGGLLSVWRCRLRVGGVRSSVPPGGWLTDWTPRSTATLSRRIGR